MTARSLNSSKSPFYRSTTDRKIKGVCGGLAERYRIDPSLVRIGWVLGTIFLMSNVSGWFMFSYFIAALVMHDRPAPAPFIPYVAPAPAPAPTADGSFPAFTFAGPTPHDPPIVVTEADLKP